MGGKRILSAKLAVQQIVNVLPAGSGFNIVKFGSIGNRNMSDEQIEFYFRAARALGAKGITREISGDAARRLGPLADKHKIIIAFGINRIVYAAPNINTIRPTTKVFAIN